VGLALPFLDAMRPVRARGAEAAPPRRLVAVCASLGLYAPNLYPESPPTAGLGASPYLDLLAGHHDQITLFSGLSHPDQAGANGHSSEATWLTGARHPGLGGFRNSISLDQYAAERIGRHTRYPSLVLSTSGQTSQSYNRGGVMVPAASQPSRIFAQLFLEGSAAEVEAQVRRLRGGRSVLDTVGGEARRLAAGVGAEDRDKLDEYFTAVRELEQRMVEAEEWTRRPKPKVEATPPKDIDNASDLIGRMRLLLELIPLALQTDSTRLISVLVQGRNDVPPVPGVTIDHHNLSHHGQDPLKIEQLRRVEEAELRALADLLTALRGKREAGGTLLDHTQVLFGSNLGNANSHDWRNLPILLAGGGYRHGRRVAFDPKDNRPLGNLFVSLLQGLGVKTDRFATSSGTLDLRASG
jgi:hypothetical protein